MKNLWKTISNFFKTIWYIIDKKIVVPITKVILKLTSRFDKQGKLIENWLAKTNTLLFISLILAIAIFIIIDQKIIVFSSSSAEVLRRQTVKAIYNEEAYVIEGLPETVDITLIGSKADLYIAKQSPTSDVEIDLSSYKEGTYKVNINYNNVSSSIDYNVNPSVATVIVYKKMSQTRTLTYDILNQDKLQDTLVISNVKINTNEVVIKGAEYQLNKVASVKALVDVNNLVKQEIGTYTLRDVVLRAYDEKGNVIDVEIVPKSIDVEVTISSPSKEVPIRVIPKGEVSFGQAISSITPSTNRVTIYGTEEALANIEYLPVEIDVNNLKNDYEYRTELVRPTGIKSMSVNNITINVTLGTVTEKDIENVNIGVRNLKDGYSAQGSSMNDTSVTVNVKGVESVLKEIDANDVVAYIDLSGYGEGTHEVEVQVEGNDPKVQYLSKTRKISITIRKN